MSDRPPPLFNDAPPPEWGDLPPLPLDDLALPSFDPLDDFVDVAMLVDHEWDLPEADVPPIDSLDDLFADLAQDLELETTSPDWDTALAEMGLTRESEVPLAIDSPPLVHPESDTNLWFGVIRPEEGDQAFMGILAAQEDRVSFAPVATGDYEQVYDQAQNLIHIAEQQGIDQALAQAMSLSVENQQFEGWQHEWGTDLPDSSQSHVQDYLSGMDL